MKYILMLTICIYAGISFDAAAKTPAKASAAVSKGSVKTPEIKKEKVFERGTIPPSAEILQDIRKNLPEWDAVVSRAYTSGLYSGPPTWQIILSRPISRRAAKETHIRNAFMVIYMVQNSDSAEPMKMKDDFQWETPHSELQQHTVYLGKAQGYLWFVKADLFHVQLLQQLFGTTGGENMQKIMAYALNCEDFDHFSARCAILYFRNRKDDSPKYIMAAANAWRKEKNAPPLQHLEALRVCGGKEASDILIRIAMSRNRELARIAIDHLLKSPELAPETFLRKLLYLPEYTIPVLDIMGKRQKLSVIHPDLQRIIRSPRSLVQFATAVDAERRISGKNAGAPEIAAANHIRLRMVRLGETADSNKFFAVDSNASHVTDKAERKRIQPMLDVILKSKDTDASVAAGLLLFSLDQGNEKYLTKEYLERVHAVGLEILQTLPAKKVQPVISRLLSSMRETHSVFYLKKVAREMGIQP